MPYTFEQLLQDTSDLLYRVRMYDKDLQYGEEIMEMDDILAGYEEQEWASGMDAEKRKAAEELLQMRQRLFTMFEDLLFIGA